VNVRSNQEQTIMRRSTSEGSLLANAATWLVAASAFLFAGLAVAAPSGTVDLTLYKAGFIVGGSGGSGTLTFKGKKYPVSIGGVSLGATIGAE
jgi:hypothetical protein